jgi:broad specificity phosphatase PhoE
MTVGSGRPTATSAAADRNELKETGVRLILIRHGESHHTLRGVIGGAAGCTGLTERGIRQAQALAGRLRATSELDDCSALLCSPWPRARQTADILASALSAGLIEEASNLCEVNPGEADGLAWEDYRARYGAFDLQTSPSRPFAPGGESWDEFTVRVRATLDSLRERFDGQTVVAITHAGFVVAAFLGVIDATLRRPGMRLRLDPAHTALTEWRVSGTTWQLARYNDAHHLSGHNKQD